MTHRAARFPFAGGEAGLLVLIEYLNLPRQPDIHVNFIDITHIVMTEEARENPDS
jgi:hypothetical protein